MTKKKSNKQAWLDWLADDPPAAKAESELRERYVQQANTFRPVNRSLQGSQSQPPVSTQSQAVQTQQPIRPQVPGYGHQAPRHAPQTSVASPQRVVQPQAVSNTAMPPKVDPAASYTAKPTTPATVSIQIHLPTFQSERWRAFKTKIKWVSKRVVNWFNEARRWFLAQLAAHKARTIGLSVITPIVIALFFAPLFFNFGSDKSAAGSGGASGASAGSTVKYEKPPFEVVTPSGKSKLATPDGVNAAYDGEKNTYSFGDSISGNGFTLSQQPIPPQFSDGTAAVESIAPTINKGVTPAALKILTGTAYVSTNPKYNSQTVVANVRDVLIFITSSHAFKSTEWENYLNTLQ